MTDTEPEVARKFYEMIMTRPGEQRLMMGVRSFDAARTIVLASLPKGLSDGDRKLLLFERIYGAPIEDFLSGRVIEAMVNHEDCP